jgi:hypothetical protein
MSETKKPTKKPRKGVLSPHLVPGNPGNSGGKKGRSGRPPDEFRDRLRAMASADDVEAYLSRCLHGEFGPKFFLSALTYASDRGYGKPKQPLEHAGEDGGPIAVKVTRTIVRPGDDA